VSVWRREEQSSLLKIPGGGRHPGFRESVTLRGAMPEQEPRSVREDDGSIQPTGQRIDDGTSGVLEELNMRRGVFTQVVLRQQAA